MSLDELKALTQQLGWPLLTGLYDTIVHLDQQSTGNAERLAKAMEREEAATKEHAETIAKLRQDSAAVVAKLQAENKLLAQAKAELAKQVGDLQATVASMESHPDVKAAKLTLIANQLQRLHAEAAKLQPPEETSKAE